MIGRAKAARKVRVIAVNDAVYPLWFADIVYAADASWWDEHRGLPGYRGEKWSSHGHLAHNNKLPAAERYGLYLIRGEDGERFSANPSVIHYGENSGFQAINIACHAVEWDGLVILVGFDMKMTGGRRHFFGDHPAGLRSTQQGYNRWPGLMAKAAAAMPKTMRIVNCTPESALDCFPFMPLDAALSGKATADAS